MEHVTLKPGILENNNVFLAAVFVFDYGFFSLVSCILAILADLFVRSMCTSRSSRHRMRAVQISKTEGLYATKRRPFSTSLTIFESILTKRNYLTPCSFRGVLFSYHEDLRRFFRLIFFFALRGRCEKPAEMSFRIAQDPHRKEAKQTSLDSRKIKYVQWQEGHFYSSLLLASACLNYHTNPCVFNIQSCSPVGQSPSRDRICF